MSESPDDGQANPAAPAPVTGSREGGLANPAARPPMNESPDGRPLVSVIMVTYGGTQWIRPAVEALAANTEAAYELIIVDNASPPDTVELLRSLEGATVILNDRNVGFGPGANQGVLHATGRFVCILNSDAFVEPGWLPPLIDALESDPRAGAAVPRLLHVDGRLQEAAGVVGRDGSTRALGDGDDPEALPYRFRRYADYGSAACLVMRRRDFAAVGGFDPAYPLGYCEDVDLCFALHERGLRTVYQPRSRVRHVRWGSSSRLEAERRVFANQPILQARWRERLAGRPSFAQPPFRDYDILQARDADAPDRVLVLNDTAWGWPGPLPRRIQRLATGLMGLWPDSRVTLLTAPSATGSPEVLALLDGGVEVAAEDDWDAWFESRRFHYSAVIVPGPAAFERFDPLLAATQPQASTVFDLARIMPVWAEALLEWWPALGSGPAASRPGRLASLESWGIRSADVVLHASGAAGAYARGIAPAVPAVLVPAMPGDRDPAPAAAARWETTEGLVALGQLPAGPRFASLQPGAGADLLAPLRWIRDELAGLAPDLADQLAPGEGLAGLGSWPGVAPPRPRVAVVAPPLTIDAEDLPPIPVVTWRGGVTGLDLGNRLAVAADPGEAARQLRDLHEDPARWEEAREAWAQVAQAAADPAGHRLWAALAHCGFAPPRSPAGSEAGSGVETVPGRGTLSQSRRPARYRR